MSTITTINGMRIQTADMNKTLTDGESYSKKVYLGDSAPVWNEMPDSEVPENMVEIEDAEILDIILDR